jgi:hypothetical protein
MVWRFTTEADESIYLLLVSVKRNSYFTWTSNQTMSLWRLSSEMLHREVVNTDRRFRGACCLHQQCDGLIDLAKKKAKNITRHIKSTRNWSLQIWFKLFYQLRRFSRNTLHFIHRLMDILIIIKTNIFRETSSISVPRWQLRRQTLFCRVPRSSESH